MSLSKSEFNVLRAYAAEGSSSPTQRELSRMTGLSLGSVNRIRRILMERGLMGDAGITPAGYDALAPYKVENAIIMAAGLSSRFAPISYEKPKGVLVVRGEVLIERQIRQLQEAGITDITVVVGYMKEAFFYLEDKFGVKIRVNEEYASRNNNSTLMLVREQLGNTYICSSDDYFTENVFEPYVYEAYYAATFAAGETNEYCMETARNGRITKVSVGGCDAWTMLGHVYFDRAFSRAFVDILQREYDKPETAGKLWEDIFVDHVKELRMTMRRYDAGVVHEFDSIAELREFDDEFLDNVDSSILDNICRVMGCERRDISGIVPIKEGLTNLSFKFFVHEKAYVYRHPGVGTDEIINRQSETYSQQVSKELGIDDTFIYEDPDGGWKISRFVDGCEPFDYHDPDHVRRAMALARKLHGSGRTSKWKFDLVERAHGIIDLLGARSYPSFPDYELLRGRIDRLYELVRADAVEPCLCHSDFYAPNFLVTGDEMYVIDWEYSAMSDYASDLGTFICCSDYTEDEALDVIRTYFQREPTPEEARHCIAFVAFAAFYWFVWALYKEATGDPVGEWLYLWYRYTKQYSLKALELYGASER